MAVEALEILDRPKLRGGTMLLALTGWMDGGLVSTGTVRRMMDGRRLREIARIDPDPFYIYNFPGSMDVAALFRPAVKYLDGIVTELDMPANVFHCDPKANLVFFLGQEPNLRWPSFADCIFTLAAEVGVERIVFMGSFGGSVPHTREPRMFGSISHERLKPLLDEFGVKPSDYEGPGSFASYLLQQAEPHGVEMISIAAEIPGYLQGLNPLSIMAVTRRLARLLNQPVDMDALRAASTEWEAQVSEAVEKDEKMAALVRKLEDQYDNELIGRPPAPEEEEEEEEAEEEE
jgi:proteasome assembly chaperone (PAC2) family protein